MKKRNIIIILAVIAVIAISACIIVNKIQKENKKYEIAQINEYKYFVVKENEKYGVINTNGNIIIEAKYDDIKIPNPEKAVFICYENDKTKVLNEKGEEKTYTWCKDNFYMVDKISDKINPGYPLNSISKYKANNKYFTNITKEDKKLINVNEDDVVEFIAREMK